MLPHLLGIDEREAGPLVQVPPPPSFRAPVGRIRNVYLASSVGLPPGQTAAQKAGLRYEAKILRTLSASYPGKFLAQPRLGFCDDRGQRWCVPDGLYHDRIANSWVVVEIKSQHMPEAWWQLRRLYEPVLRAYVEGAKICLLEICQVFEPAMPFPERPLHVESLPEMLTKPNGSFGVLKWKL